MLILYLVNVDGCFRPYDTRPIMHPYSHRFRPHCEAKHKSPIQLLTQDSSQVTYELCHDISPVFELGTLHLDSGNGLQPPNHLWKSAIVHLALL